MKPAGRHEIIHDYLETLDLLKSPIRIEWELPRSKREIQQAIREELLENPGSDIRDQLEMAYAEIESFISVEEYELLSRFRETCSIAEQLAESGTPGDILASSRLMERICGEKAVKVLERISHAMRKQLDSIRSVQMVSSTIDLENASPI